MTEPWEKDTDKILPVLVREGIGVLSIGWDLGIPIVGGALLGHFLDAWLGTAYSFTLGLLVLGVMIAYWNLSRLIHRVNRQDQERAQQAPGEKRG